MTTVLAHPTSPNTAALMSLLDQECNALRDFVEALEQEQQLLARSADMEALPGLVERKSALYRQLNSLGNARTAWLTANRFADIAAASSVMVGVGEQWNEIISLAKVAKSNNDTNGRLVRTRMSYNRAALDSIRAAHGTTPSVYGRDGRY